MTTNASSNAVRALDILIVLGEAGADGFALADIAERIGEAKPAVHRSLVSLLQKGFAEPAGKHGFYRLGPAIPMLARGQARLEPLISKFRPGMTEFARRSGHTVYMMVQAGVDAVCAEMVSRFPDRQFTMGVGGRVPMGVAAGSVALMSIMPEADCLALLEANAPRYLSHPSVQYVDKAVVMSQIEDARRRSFAVNMAYYLPGEGGLGLPVRATSPYELNAAISFTAPLEMMTEDWLPKIIDELRDCLGDAIQPVPAS
ncbi:IclR family transcriptional regulator [Ochrobactrum pecoris]|uniref:IclR family transcriptional regulator n=1 Tax=Brucella pecoris TaxID=867683 RepID=A0A5C5CGX7_9HYPH|nr:IclR family transcriptional regulator [Brucella pecoris]MBB4095205.1 DNA-binding IclR family transcriptional regulator [Brucella pecoris]NKW81655.1 IclR family transcriptional regulator [Brucella pecoris]TNV10570.1 IclR family transcriptional regulator [Brucella pecoris]